MAMMSEKMRVKCGTCNNIGFVRNPLHRQEEGAKALCIPCPECFILPKQDTVTAEKDVDSKDEQIERLEAKCKALERELLVTDEILADRTKVLEAIPECSVHGNTCIPSALAWIKEKNVGSEKETIGMAEAFNRCFETPTTDEIILAELRLIRQELQSLHQRCVEPPDEEEFEELLRWKQEMYRQKRETEAAARAMALSEVEQREFLHEANGWQLNKPEPSEPSDSRCAGCKLEDESYCQPRKGAETCGGWWERQAETPEPRCAECTVESQFCLPGGASCDYQREQLTPCKPVESPDGCVFPGFKECSGFTEFGKPLCETCAKKKRG